MDGTRIFGAAALACAVSLACAAPALASTHADREHEPGRGALFVMTNETYRSQAPGQVTEVGNSVVMYDRDPDGALRFVATFPTGRPGQPQLGAGPAPTAQIFERAAGLGPVQASADGLGSSSSLLLDRAHRCLFAVNAGSNSVSSFRVHRTGLQLVSIADSGGTFPVSLAERDGLLYVLNSGLEGALFGFRVQEGCGLAPIAGSRRSLRALNDAFPSPAPGEVLTTPSHIGFSPDGRRLLLAIKGGDAVVENGALKALPSGRMAVFPVRAGLFGAPVVTPFRIAEKTGGPFSFVFTGRHTLAVVAANSGTVASYRLNEDDTLSLLRAPIEIPAFAPCWIAATGRFVYTSSFGAPSGVQRIFGSSGQPDQDGAIHGFRLTGSSAPTGAGGSDQSNQKFVIPSELSTGSADPVG
jgi:hypothetical protein